MTDISVVSESRGSQRGLLADRAYRALRDRLVTLRIPPGSPIDEDAIGRELKMGRTPGAVQTQAAKIGQSLKPTNQRPYTRRMK